MFDVKKITPAVGAELSGVSLSKPFPIELQDAVYEALLENLVIFFRGANLSPSEHMAFAECFGQLNEPNPLYAHVDGFERIMVLENDASTPPDTDSWHTDMTFRSEQPFASVLVARSIPPVGGDTLWSSNYAAYDRLPDGMRRDLEDLEAVHDCGDFRNNFAASANGTSREDRLSRGITQFGHSIKPLIDTHPVTGRPFLNFNEAFVTHIVGMTTSESNVLKAFLANHMNKPEDQMRWRWQAGDVAMWDNRVTMHYAIADYLPQYRCMNRITVVNDCRAQRVRKVAG